VIPFIPSILGDEITAKDSADFGNRAKQKTTAAGQPHDRRRTGRLPAIASRDAIASLDHLSTAATGPAARFQGRLLLVLQSRNHRPLVSGPARNQVINATGGLAHNTVHLSIRMQFWIGARCVFPLPDRSR